VATALTDNSQQKPNKVGDPVVRAQAATGAARVVNAAIVSQRECGNQLKVPPIQDTPVSDPSGRKRDFATSGGFSQSSSHSGVSKRPKSSESRLGSVANEATSSHFSGKQPPLKKKKF